MSILIKGLEMPTVEHGVRTINIYADGVVTNYAEDTIATAVPVPPHGRLIDADALVEECMKEDGFIAEMLFRKVSNAPTIIPADKEGE